jgi:Lrp/AsnC family transcriptional regulator, regulator for asnA, asnC and gidA
MGNHFDETSREIVKQLRDGRKSYDQIAKKLSITTNTVRARVKKLQKEGVFDITGRVDPDHLDNHFLALIGVKLKKMNLLKKGEQFSKLKGVVSVCVVTGQFDLFLIVLLNNEFGLLDFLTKELSKVEEVLSTETFVVYKNFNLKVPYVL